MACPESGFQVALGWAKLEVTFLRLDTHTPPKLFGDTTTHHLCPDCYAKLGL